MILKDVLKGIDIIEHKGNLEIKSKDPEKEFSDGSKVGQFWPIHNPKIIEELKKPEYDKGYEVARETVRKYMDQKKNRRQKVKDIKNIKEEKKSNART